jgi:hypothetical protein
LRRSGRFRTSQATRPSRSTSTVLNWAMLPTPYA